MAAGRLSFTVEDELGVKASVTEYLNVDAGATAGDLTGAWQAQATLLDAILSGRIVGGEAVVTQAMAGGKAAPIAHSRVAQTAVFDFSATGTSRRYGLALPAISDALIANGRITITEDSPVDLWADTLVAAVAGGAFTNATGQSLVELLNAYLTFRKRGNLPARSRELVTV